MSPLKLSALALSHGRREHRKHVTRRDLLVAGRRLFGEKGLYDSRIEDLSRHAGIAKGTLYGYFANKEELIKAVVTSGFSELLGHVHREVNGARTHAEVVERLVETHLKFFEENADLMRIFHQVHGLLTFNRPEAQRLRPVLMKYMGGLAHVLALHHPARKGREREQLETATLLFGAVSGISSTRESLAGSRRRTSHSRTMSRAISSLVLAFEGLADRRRESAADKTGASVTPSKSSTGRARRPGSSRGRKVRPHRTTAPRRG